MIDAVDKAPPHQPRNYHHISMFFKRDSRLMKKPSQIKG